MELKQMVVSTLRSHAGNFWCKAPVSYDDGRCDKLWNFKVAQSTIDLSAVQRMFRTAFHQGYEEGIPEHVQSPLSLRKHL